MMYKTMGANHSRSTVRFNERELYGRVFPAHLNGQIDKVFIQRWMNTNCVDTTYGKCSIIEWAANHGYLHVVDYIVCNDNGTRKYETAVACAASNGHLDVIHCFHQHNVKLTAKAMCSAAGTGRLHVVKYLHQNGVDITVGAMREAVGGGRLNVVTYLHENGVTSPDDVICMASRRGYLEIVKYLHENGADITVRDNESIRQASSHNHLSVVEYLLNTNVYPTEFIRTLRSENDQIQNLLTTYECMVMVKGIN